MAELFYKRGWLSDPEGRAEALSQRYPGGWHHGHGAGVKNLARVLQAEGVRTFRVHRVQPAAVFAYLRAYASEWTPIILHVHWSNGGHFIVCKQVYQDGTVICLDPWYRLVETSGDDMPTYHPSGAHGKFSGWMVITRR
jgi:hypothetical protein